MKVFSLPSNFVAMEAAVQLSTGGEASTCVFRSGEDVLA